MPVALVTDSTADIPPEIAKQLNIQVIPTILVVDGQQYLDGEGIPRDEFYRRLPDLREPATTAAPSAGTFESVYEDVFDRGFDRILSIHASARLSSLCDIATLAASRFGGRVHVEDSGSVSLGMGFQVIFAAELAAQGAGLPEILNEVRALRSRVRVFAMLDTLDQLRLSGRVSWARAGLGSLLQIKPFIELRDGDVLNRGQTRTRSKGIAHLSSLLNDLGPLERLAILHTNAEPEAQPLLESLQFPPPAPPLIVNVTPIIGAHVGVRGLGFAAVMVM